MTSDEFRQQPEFTKRMQEILSDPVFQQALATLKAEGDMQDAQDDAEALASVRILARQRGRMSAISELITLASPILTERPNPLPSFGIDATPEELAEAYGLQPS